MTRYVVQHNGLPSGNPTDGAAAKVGAAINSHPWRLYDTVERRAVGWYTNEDDAQLLGRFMNGPEDGEQE